MARPHSLTDFIRHSHAEIISQFEAFARTFSAVSAHMTAEELQDHSAELLKAIVADLETTQTPGEQVRKSEGHGTARAMEASGKMHADARIRHGFSLGQVIAEFRALRASVLSLYEAHDGPIDLVGVRRFNEAIDEGLSSSAARFSERLAGYKEQCLGMLGHDLRSPLGAIVAGATLLTMPLDADPQQRPRVANLILRSAQRMERMIDDLLDLTRSRLGTGIPVRLAPANLNDICAHAILEVQAGHPPSVITYDHVGDLRGEWDAPRLMQVATNLLSNALEHGGGTPVRMVADGTRDHVQLSVNNFGPTIPREFLPSIFEPLVRYGPPNRSSPGLGLGLFIVHAIIAAHYGTITVVSSAETGTTFEITLPRIPTSTARPPLHHS